MKEKREYPYFKNGEKIRCIKNSDDSDIFQGEKLIEGQTYEVIYPQCTPNGILVKNESGKESWCKYHHFFEWI